MGKEEKLSAIKADLGEKVGGKLQISVLLCFSACIRFFSIIPSLIYFELCKPLLRILI